MSLALFVILAGIAFVSATQMVVARRALRRGLPVTRGPRRVIVPEKRFPDLGDRPATPRGMTKRRR